MLRLVEMTANQPQIAFLLPHMGMGGAEKVLVQLAHEFTRRGLTVDFVLFKAEGPLLDMLPSEVRIIDFDQPISYLCLPKLVQYLRREKPEVLLSTLELSSILALLARMLSRGNTRIAVRIAVTISHHSRTKIKKWIESKLVSWLYPKADRIIFVSKGVARDFRSFTGLAVRQGVVIYNPIITPQLLLDADQPVDHPFLKTGQPDLVLGVGRLTEQKDFGTLIRAFAHLRKSRSLKLIILGEGEQRPYYESLIRSLDLSVDVDLPGQVMNPYAYMRQAEVFVLSSRWEGLPGTLIQALACGAPVVSTNCPSGPNEILNDGKYGHLVPVGDEEAITDAIGKVLDGKDTRKPPETWMKQFESDMVIKQYLAALDLE